MAVLTAVATLVLTPATPANGQRTDVLELAIVVTVTGPPLFALDGDQVRNADSRMQTVTEALEALARPELDDIPLALAVTPVYCDEVAHLGTPAARRATTLLRELSIRRPTLAMPYADVRLADIPSRAAVRRELAAGSAALESCARIRPTDVALPPDLVLDDDALGALDAGGVSAALAPAIEVGARPTRSGEITLLPTEPIAPGDSPNDAFLRFGDRDAAVAHVGFGRTDLATFIDALANDPRVALRPLADLTTDPVVRHVTFPSVAPPPASYRAAVARAERALERFRSYTLPDNPIGGVLTAALARARSSAEWDGRWVVGRQRASGVERTLRRQERVVSAAQGSVTFTSRRGSIPVTVTNGATYPIRVRVSLLSSKLEFPDGATKVVTVDPPGDTILFPALARSSGTFPAQVRVTSPRSEVTFHAGELTVRSTAANIPALVLTIGGAIFLAGWAARQFRRRRQKQGRSS